MSVKMSKQPPPAPTASAVGPCPTEIQIVGRPGTGSLPSTIAPPTTPCQLWTDGRRGERGKSKLSLFQIYHFYGLGEKFTRFL